MSETGETPRLPITEEQRSLRKRVDFSLSQSLSLKEEPIDIGEWSLFNWSKLGWAVRPIQEPSGEGISVNIRKFKRPITPEDHQQISLRALQSPTEKRVTRPMEQGRLFDGIIPTDPNEDVILESDTFNHDTLIRAFVIASLAPEKMKLMKTGNGPLRMVVNEGSMRFITEPEVASDWNA